jgi:phospholipid/cholesterol/gamma-HCH transport system substrate-binding protein
MKTETKVGLLFVISILMVTVFAYYLGILNPFSNSNTLKVMYNYAGGLDEGSPVRLMGIKVGKVTKIEFDTNQKSSSGEEVKLKVLIEIEKRAWSGIRHDSKFFINLAGVIGEKFLEISPGSLAEPEFKSGDSVRGEDPPRVDQLISQSYGLAGKIIEMVNKNEGSVSSIIGQLDRLVTNFNRTLAILDKTSKNKEMSHLVDNAIKISDNLAYLSTELRTEKAEQTFKLLNKLLFRLEPLDGPALKKFFQEEGIKAKMF